MYYTLHIVLIFEQSWISFSGIFRKYPSKYFVWTELEYDLKRHKKIIDIYLMDDALSAVLSSCDEVTIFFPKPIQTSTIRDFPYTRLRQKRIPKYWLFQSFQLVIDYLLSLWIKIIVQWTLSIVTKFVHWFLP